VEAGVKGADTDVRDWNPESSTPQLGGIVKRYAAFLYITCKENNNYEQMRGVAAALF